MSECIFEKAGSKKYRLLEPYNDILHFSPPMDIANCYCIFNHTGELIIDSGYEWDGPSGPAIDSDNFMDGSLVHDLLYQLMREKWLEPVWKYRMKADKEMRLQTAKDGMSSIRKWYTWLGVRVGGILAARSW